MKEKKQVAKKLSFDLLFEKWYPLFWGTFSVILYVSFSKYIIVEDIDNLLNVIISYASILLGFVGVLISLIYSILNAPVTKAIMNDKHYRSLFGKYFMRCCESGFILVGLSVSLLLRTSIKNILSILLGSLSNTGYEIIRLLWIFLLVYFTTSSYRVIALMSKTVFLGQQEDTATESSSVCDYTSLQDKYEYKEHVDK